MNTPVSERLRYHALVDSALYRLALKVARDPSLRPLLLTDPTTTTAALDGSGVADLSTLISSQRILIECLPLGDVTHSSSTFALRFLPEGDHAALANALDVLFLKYALDGTKLYTYSADRNATPLTGSIALAVPYWPTLAQLPESLVERLVECCIELLAEEHADYEQDGGE